MAPRSSRPWTRFCLSIAKMSAFSIFAIAIAILLWNTIWLPSLLRKGQNSIYVKDAEELFLQHYSLANNFMETTKTTFLDGPMTSESSETSKLIKIVGFVNTAMLPLAYRWYDIMTELGYREHILIAVEEETYDILRKATTPSGARYRVEKHLHEPGSLRSLWYERLEYVRQQVEVGNSILLTDVDNVFVRYVPLSQFENDPEADVFHAYENKFPKYVFKVQGFVFCGGMGYFKGNARVLKLFELFVYNCINGKDTKKCNDQVMINSSYASARNTGNEKFFRPLRMNWNFTPETSGETAIRSKEDSEVSDGLLEIGVTGVSPVTGHKVKVWDRSFAYRGPFIDGSDVNCREGNWVSMPHAKSTTSNKVEIKLEAMNLVYSACAMKEKN